MSRSECRKREDAPVSATHDSATAGLDIDSDPLRRTRTCDNSRPSCEIVQFYGDGTLSVFGSAVEAVSAAVAAQRVLQQGPAIPVRIGLHMGDINRDEDGVYGDGVNVASRIEGLSVPGAVLISGKVFDEIKNHPELPATALGEFDLKNVRGPVRVFAITAPGLVVPDTESMAAQSGPPEKSIAVLPFVNMSADPENEFFSDGISEELINVLARVEGLRVTARTSSFAFKGKSKDVRDIGRKLGGPAPDRTRRGAQRLPQRHVLLESVDT